MLRVKALIKERSRCLSSAPVVIVDASHAPPIDNPIAFNAAVKDLLR